MKYNEIVDTCVDYLRRPDLVKLVQERVLNAITAVHSVGIFPEDYAELVVPTQSPARIAQVTRPADLRLIEQVFLLDAQGNILETLVRKSVSEIVKLRLLNRTAGTYYEAGGSISYNSSVDGAAQVLVVGTLKQVPPSELQPVTTKLITLDNFNYESWLMAENSQAIIDYTVGHMEYVLGNMEQGSNFLRVYNTTHRDWLESRAAGTTGV